MAKINLTVTPRRTLTATADGKYLITPDVLNDLGRPIVTGDLDETDFVASIEISVGAQVSSSIPVTVQAKLGDGNYARRIRMEAWLTQDTTNASVASVLPSGSSVAQWTVISNTDGSASIVLTHNNTAEADATWYLCICINGPVFMSAAITFPGTGA